jgi:hypothetical protein
LGPYPELPGQKKTHWRIVFAELVAFHSVRRVVETRWKRVPAEALILYRDHMRLERKCLPRIHAALVGHDEIEAASI